MDICQDINRLLFEFVEPTFGSILDAWLTYARTTKSKAKFAREMRFHIPTANILWLDLEYAKGRFGNRHVSYMLFVQVTRWVGTDRSNHSIERFDLSYRPGTNAGVEPTTENVIQRIAGVTASTKVDLGFGHYNRFWTKPKQKAVLGIPENDVKQTVLDARFLKQQ
jgi:hypothetical protein